MVNNLVDIACTCDMQIVQSVGEIPIGRGSGLYNTVEFPTGYRETVLQYHSTNEHVVHVVSVTHRVSPSYRETHALWTQIPGH